MTSAVQRRRGTTAQHASFTGLLGEFTYDTDKKTVVVHDGSTAGGNPLPTLTGTETFTNKTLTSPTINGTIASSGLTLPDITLGGTITSNGQTFSGTIADLGTVTTVDINGGTIDGAVIGGSSAASGTFTTVSASQSFASTGGSAPGISAPVVSMYYNTASDYAVISSLHNGVAWKPIAVRSNGLIFQTNSDVEAARFSGDSLLIGTSTTGASKLVVADDSIQINAAKTPSSASDTGTTGQFAWDSNYFYICVGTNAWQRVAHATW